MFDLAGDWLALLQVLALTVVRMLAAFAVVPFLGRETFPGMLRNGTAISLSVVLLPLVQSQLPETRLVQSEFVLIVVKEVVLGLMLGYLTGVVFWAASSAGAIIDTQRGASLGGVLNPQLGDDVTPLGSFFSQALITLFLVGGGLLIVLEGIYQSYLAWPVYSFFPRLDLAGSRFFLEQFDVMFYMAMFVAGPIALAMFIAEFGLALVSRFVPQLNVFVLAMPVKSAVAMLLLALYATTMLLFFKNEIRKMSDLFNALGRLVQ